ncbi:MAG TPA: prepilin peptidase [Solirubrobacterales bacterium]|nr:prepilin peptidase [Solirubrobacterales bacterium]
MAAIASFGFLGGAVTGSFLSVVAHRVPRGESIVGPRSRCASCGVQIAAYDNIPILSWLLLRGRCRHCGERISVRYPLIEVATGLLFAATALVLRDEPAQLVLGLVFVATLAAITLTDLELRVIPNKVLIVSAGAGVVLAAALDPSSLPERAIGAAAAGGLLFAVALAYPRGMGMGDVKLAAVMGLYLGRSVAPALLIAFAAGSLFGLALIARHGAAARKQAVPFGPFLALGGVIGLLAGDQIVDWYLGTF